MQKSINICGRECPVIGEAKFGVQKIPVAEITLMSDIKWQRLALEGRLRNHDDYAKYCDDDVDAAIERLERWLEEHDPEYTQWRKELSGRAC